MALAKGMGWASHISVAEAAIFVIIRRQKPGLVSVVVCPVLVMSNAVKVLM